MITANSMDVNAIVAQLTRTFAQSGDIPSAEDRKSEVAMYEELKNHGDVHLVIQIGAELTTRADLFIQAQLMGYSVLQYVAGNRWDQLSPEQKDSILGLCFKLLEGHCLSQDAAGGLQGGVSFALRSKCAVLFAIVLKRHGAVYANESIRRLIGDEARYRETERTSALATYHAVVCMIFRYLVDEVYQFAGDMSGDHARDMLACTSSWIPEILRFTESAIEANYAVYSNDAQNKDSYFAVKSALESGALFAEVAPASSMFVSGIIKAAGYFIRQNALEELRDISCGLLKNIGSRKQTADENMDDFRHAMQEVGVFLTTIASELLGKANAGERLSYNGDDEDFGSDVVDAMVDLGKTHLLVAFTDDASRFAFLEHMLSFAKHPHLPLSGKALGLWVKLLHDSATIASSGTSEEKNTLPAEAVLVLMQLAAEKLQQRNARVPQIDDEIPIYFDDFEEYKEFMVGYRLKLSAIVRSAAATLPEQALQATVAQLLESISLANSMADSSNISKDSIEKARSSLEAAAVFSESTIKAVWEAVNAAHLSEESKSGRKQAFSASLEPVYTSAIKLRVSDGRLLNSHARALGSFSRFIMLRPDLVKDSISNILDILVSCIPLTPGEHEAPPPLPSTVWREAAQARTAVATVLLDYAKFCQDGFLPHVEDIAGTVTQLYSSRRIRPGERNILIEALLAACVSAPPQVQETVIDWSMHPIKSSWTSSAVQQTISSVKQFVLAYLPVYMEGNEVRIGGAKERYLLYHQVHMIERVIRRLSTESAKKILFRHLEWIIPFLNQILSCLNALQTSEGVALLGSAAAILSMSLQEKAHYLRRGQPRLQPIPGDSDAGDYSTVGGATVSSGRAWLRHIVEFVSHSLGLSLYVVPSLVGHLQALSPKAAPLIFAHLDAIEHRYLRIILRHVTIPWIKNCPYEGVTSWVIPSLSLLAPHMKARLAAAWQTLNTELSNQVPSYSPYAVNASQATEEDVINDRIVREISQEYADLLKELATRQFEAVESQPKKTLLEIFLAVDPVGGLAAAAAAVEGMMRPDEAAYKYAAFCRALVNLAPADASLYNYVGSEILYNTISSLSLEVMLSHQAEILGMIRAIIVQQMDNPQSQIHSVLAMLPGVGPAQISSFIASIKSTGSEKEQRNHVKAFLLSTAGRGSFTALARWKPPGGASAVQGIKHRSSRIQKSPHQEEADERLQGDITRHLFESS